MSHSLRSVRVALLSIAFLCLTVFAHTGQPPVVRVGIVIDGPWERNDELRKLFEKEILDLTAGEFDVRFPADKLLQGDWTLDGVKAAIDKLLADPEIDFLLTLSPVASTYACRIDELPKPVIAAFVLNPELQGIPYKDGSSGVKNLSYVKFPANISRDLRRFRELTPISKIAFLINTGLTSALPDMADNLMQEVGKLDIQARIVSAGTSVQETLAAIPADVQAVYVAPLIQLPPGDFDRLVAGLIERRLPSFSYWGRSEVEQGILTSLYLETDFQRIARRIALNMQRILLGEDAGSLSVELSRSERLTINMETARAIGVYPTWGLITEAELINEEITGIERQLTLDEAAREAIAANLDLAASDRNVTAGYENVKKARSTLYPQFEVSGSSQFIDPDRSNASFGILPQRTVVGAGTVTQLIYSEPARANIDIQQHLQDARIQEREQLRLDITLDATTAYLDVLRAKTFERVQKDNLKVTRSNLELAQKRREIGVAGPSEVYRWENQIATNRRDVIDAITRRNQAQIALNRVLHRPIEEHFTTGEADLDDPVLQTTANRLTPYVDNPWSFEIFRNFMAQEGLSLAPELRRLDAGIAAQQRALLSADRAFWHPEVALQGEVSSLAKSGSNINFDLGGNLPFTLPSANKINWTVGIKISLPFFDGGARRADQARAIEELSRLRLERQAAVERIEQRIRSTLHEAGASFAGIKLANDSNDAAHKNLDFVTSAYSRGVVSILELLDAQNAALLADLAAANAVYDYLIDLMKVQRAIGRFDFFLTPDEKQSFFDRLEEFFRQAGYTPRK